MIIMVEIGNKGAEDVRILQSSIKVLTLPFIHGDVIIRWHVVAPTSVRLMVVVFDVKWKDVIKRRWANSRCVVCMRGIPRREPRSPSSPPILMIIVRPRSVSLCLVLLIHWPHSNQLL